MRRNASGAMKRPRHAASKWQPAAAPSKQIMLLLLALVALAEPSSATAEFASSSSRNVDSDHSVPRSRGLRGGVPERRLATEASAIRPGISFSSRSDTEGSRVGTIDVSGLGDLSEMDAVQNIRVQLFSDEPPRMFRRIRRSDEDDSDSDVASDPAPGGGEGGYSGVRTLHAEDVSDDGGYTMSIVSVPAPSNGTAGSRRMYVAGSVVTNGTIYDISTSDGMEEGMALVRSRRVEDFPEESEPIPLEDVDYDAVPNGTFWNESANDDVMGRGLKRSKKKGRRDAMLDVMVIYTPNAMCAQRGLKYPCEDTPQNRGPIEARIILAVEETNAAFELSGVDARLRLVRMHLDENVDDSDKKAWPSMGSILRSLRTFKDGFEYVPSHRDKYGADFISIITERGESCGLAPLGPNVNAAYSIVSRRCSTGYYSFGHELGHNFGCDHNPEAAANRSPEYARGYRDEKNGIRSILAYNCETRYCTRVMRFSNNEGYSFNGVKMGNDLHNNARQINSNFFIMSKYRPTRVQKALTGDFASSDKPTPVPTKKPTSFPSHKPTMIPTAHPSHAPTATPTAYPSHSPTITPSLVPSDALSGLPSVSPSRSISPSLSHRPTSVYSGVPSSLPTFSESMEPSEAPSGLPSALPSKSAVPSLSKPPTGIPSQQPSLFSSMEPSEGHSALPSSSPSEHESLSPSHNPTLAPVVDSAGLERATSYVGPYELIKPAVGDWGSYGNQFDIHASKNVRIHGLAIHTSKASKVRVEIWTRSGSHVDAHNNYDGGWNKIQDIWIIGMGRYSLTHLPQFQASVVVAAGSVQAFAVILKDGGLAYSPGASKAEVSIENDDLVIYEGSYINAYYGDDVAASWLSESARVWEGAVRYDVESKSEGNEEMHRQGGPEEAPTGGRRRKKRKGLLTAVMDEFDDTVLGDPAEGATDLPDGGKEPEDETGDHAEGTEEPEEEEEIAESESETTLTSSTASTDTTALDTTPMASISTAAVTQGTSTVASEGTTMSAEETISSTASVATASAEMTPTIETTAATSTAPIVTVATMPVVSTVSSSTVTMSAATTALLESATEPAASSHPPTYQEDGECIDDPEFQYKFRGMEVNCQWVQENQIPGCGLEEASSIAFERCGCACTGVDGYSTGVDGTTTTAMKHTTTTTETSATTKPTTITTERTTTMKPTSTTTTSSTMKPTTTEMETTSTTTTTTTTTTAEEIVGSMRLRRLRRNFYRMETTGRGMA